MKKNIKNSIIIVVLCAIFQQTSPMLHVRETLNVLIKPVKIIGALLPLAGALGLRYWLNKKYDIVRLERCTGLHGLFTSFLPLGGLIASGFCLKSIDDKDNETYSATNQQDK